MRRRMRTTLTLTAALALTGSVIVPAQADEPDLWIEQDPLALSRTVADAMATAAEQQAAPRTLATPSAPASPGEVRELLDANLDEVAAGVPVGVTARLETPTLRWQGAAGVREVDRPMPANPVNRFEIASITKTMVATVVMQEVERGTWTLDTPIVDVLPEVADLVPDAYEEAVTLEMLLTHRSGLPDHLGPLWVSRLTDPEDFDEQWDVLGQEFTTDDHLEAMAVQPWEFEPDTDLLYSNAGYVLLGMALERVTGDELDDLLDERVFRPALMRHTDYPQEPGMRGPFLVGAAYTGEFGQGWYSMSHFNPDFFGAAGAVTSTTTDLHRFIGALLDGGLVEPETVADMIDPRTVDPAIPVDFGLGIYRMPDPCVPGEYLYGHDGAAMGGYSILLASADGERRYSIGLTGRDYTVPPGEDLNLNAVLVPMVLTSC